MRYLKTKAYLIFKLVVEWELARNLLKAIINNMLLPQHLRQYAILVLSSLSFSTSFTYIRARCFISNQSRSLITFFKLNRVQFKKYATHGLLSGITKSA